ncbi:MAG: hypothetical protein ACRCXD_10660 [Luteolibacter sp.]
MKNTLCAFTLLLIQVLAQAVEIDSGLDQKIVDTFFSANSRQSDLSWITDENRQMVIENLQRRANDQYEGPYVREALAQAGHWDTILGLIEDLKDPLKETDLLRYANQEIIPYLMPLVYSGATTVSRPGSSESSGCFVMLRPTRQRAIGHLLAKIRDGESFPSKTRKWAEEMGKNSLSLVQTDEAWVSLLTSWWEHNQDAILEKRYKDAKWLPTYRGVPINRTPEEMRQLVEYLEQENATRLTKRSGPADGPGEYVRNTTTRPGETSGENPEGMPSKLFWIGIGGLVTIGSYTFWRKFAAKDA